MENSIIIISSFLFLFAKKFFTCLNKLNNYLLVAIKDKKTFNKKSKGNISTYT